MAPEEPVQGTGSLAVRVCFLSCWLPWATGTCLEASGAPHRAVIWGGCLALAVPSQAPEGGEAVDQHCPVKVQAAYAGLHFQQPQLTNKRQVQSILIAFKKFNSVHLKHHYFHMYSSIKH